MFDLIFVHGFGGFDNEPPFIKMANKAIKVHNFNCRLQNFAWNSRDIKLFEAGARFDSALKEAEKAGDELWKRILAIDSTESPYYIVGHSLGCQVIHNMLINLGGPLKRCRGIVYLGAAINNNEAVPAVPFTEGLKIVNYFSPKDDFVLNDLYYNKVGSSAGGATGLLDDAFVLNFRCSATHARNLGVVHSDWANMAWPLIEIMSINEGEPIIGGLKKNVEWRIGKGSDWWNNVVELSNWKLDDENCSVYIQQHKINFDHYRISIARPGSEKRRRLHWADKIGPLLLKIDLKPGSESWIFKSIC